MGDRYFDKTYKVLITLSFIFGIIFAIFVIGHTSMLIYERIKHPEKSKERWLQIEQKFNQKPVTKSTVYYYYPTSLGQS